eukprot:m.98301 g.98301  ORF g.98301 m.98301 type:complete len:828 (+) comp13630_c0_seq1:241-2724(+)
MTPNSVLIFLALCSYIQYSKSQRDRNLVDYAWDPCTELRLSLKTGNLSLKQEERLTRGPGGATISKMYKCGPVNVCDCYNITAFYNTSYILKNLFGTTYRPDPLNPLPLELGFEMACVFCDDQDAVPEDATSVVQWPKNTFLITATNYSLTSYPEPFFKTCASELIGLVITNSKIDSLTQETFHVMGMTRLAALVLANNEITAIQPGVFSGLAALTLLDISYNKVSMLLKGTLDPLTSLLTLFLNNNELVELPPPVSQLRVLDISYNSGILNVQKYKAYMTEFFEKYLQNHKFNLGSIDGILSSLEGAVDDIFLNQNIVHNFANNITERLLPAVYNEIKSSSGYQVDAVDCVVTLLEMACNTPQAPDWCTLVNFAIGNANQDEQHCNRAFGDIGQQVEEGAITDAMNVVVRNWKIDMPNITSSFIFLYQSLQLKAEGIPIQCNTGYADFFVSPNCSCIEHYDQDASGNCVYNRAGGFSLAFVIGSVATGLFLGIVVVLGVQSVRSIKRLKKDLDLNEMLLEKSNYELSEFKMSWRIYEEEITMVNKLDEGAYGEVWKAEWDGLTVAVKQLKAVLLEWNKSAMQEFESEVDFICKLRHRNIVRFFGACLTGKVPFLVTEFMEGGSLKSHLRENTVNWRKKMELIMDIQSGMHHIHTLGRMHRDLKTGNILLNKQMRAKIADFGSMKDMVQGGHTSKSRFNKAMKKNKDSNLTLAVGTPLYMSPEVIDGGKYTTSADVWSFAVVLWEICAQRNPDLGNFLDGFPTSGPFLITYERYLRDGHRLPLTEDICPSRGLAKIVSQCWELSPIARPSFDDVGDMLLQVEDIPQD